MGRAEARTESWEPQGQFRSLRELYVDGHYCRAECDRERADFQAQLRALRVPETPEVERGGETLESLGAEWVDAPIRYQRDMVRVIFEAVYVDTLGQRLVCVKPYLPFVPLFGMDGLEEREDGCFYYREEGSETRSEG